MFYLPEQMCSKSYYTTPSINVGSTIVIGISVSINNMLEFMFLIVMGRVLSGELSCMQTGFVVTSVTDVNCFK